MDGRLMLLHTFLTKWFCKNQRGKGKNKYGMIAQNYNRSTNVAMEHNGYVYETFGISKHFPVKLQLLLIRAVPLDNPLTAKCFIYDVVHWCLFS